MNDDSTTREATSSGDASLPASGPQGRAQGERRLNRLSWWDAAYTTALLVLGAVSWALPPHDGGTRIGSVAVLLVIAAVYVILGRPALLTGANPWPFVAMLTIASGAAAFVSPNLSSIQALVIPTAWVLVESPLIRPIVATLVVGLVVTVGFVLGLGPSEEVLTHAGTIQTMAMIFSVGLGIWITRIGEWGEERARLLTELQGAQGQLETAHREAGATEERSRLAREIHDTIAQSLTSLVLLAQRTRGELSSTPERAVETVELIESTARDALEEARALVAAIAPVGIGDGDGGLADVIDQLASRFERETGIRITSDVSASAPRDIEVVLLRCTQEGIANVRKHSRATTASITIRPLRDGAGIELVIDDDGLGITDLRRSDESGFGIPGMRARIALVGGTLELGRRAGGGTRLAVTVPSGGAPLATDSTTRTETRT